MKILCIGDACADIVIPYGSAKRAEPAHTRVFSGGTVANTASGLGRLGVQCAFLGTAGADEFGDTMRCDLQRDGVDVSRFVLRNDLSSTQILVVVDEQNERYPFLLPQREQAYLALTRQMLPDSLLSEFDLVHTSGLMLFGQPAADAVCDFLERCRANGVAVSLDINLRVETLRADMSSLRRAMDCTNYLFGSAQEELLPLTDCKTADEAAHSLVTDKRTVISRAGKDGASVYTTDGVWHCSSFPVSVVDTLGAGDSFNSGFLYALSEGKPPEAAVICGCAAAALNLTKSGARNCPTNHELTAFLENADSGRSEK